MPTRSCPVCGVVVPDDVPMVRARVYRRHRRTYAASWEPICQRCNGRGGARSEDGRTDAFAPGSAVVGVEPVPCVSCGLPVILPPDKRRKVAACSGACRTRYYTDRARRVAAAITVEPLVCHGCGTEMIGRTDRRYCSSACRQRAYRQRVTG